MTENLQAGLASAGASRHRWLPARRDTRWALALGAASFGVNIARSSVPGPGLDETATRLMASRGVAEIWSVLLNMDAYHGLYYMSMRAWSLVFGDTIPAMRIPSSIAVGVTAALIVLLGSSLWSLRWGVLGAAAFSLLPLTTWSSTEARGYALATTAVVGTLYAGWRATTEDRVRWWAAYAAGAVIALHLLLFSALSLAALPAAMASRGKAPWRRWRISTMVAALLSAPLLVAAARQREAVSWIAETEQGLAGRVAEQFVGSASLAIYAGWGLALVGAGVAVVIYRRDAGARAAVVFITAWLIIPSVLLLAASMAQPLYVSRYLITSSPAFAFVIAFAVATASRKAIAAWLVVVVFAFMPSWHTQRTLTAKTTWAIPVSVIEENKRPGDAILYYVDGVNYRTIGAAFPEAVAWLRDLNEEAQESRQYETVWKPLTPLAGSEEVASGVTRVWFVGPPTLEDSPDYAVLVDSGFREVRRTEPGSQPTVALLERR